MITNTHLDLLRVGLRVTAFGTCFGNLRAQTKSIHDLTPENVTVITFNSASDPS